MMKDRKKVLITLLVASLIGLLGIIFYYKYQSDHYVKTEDARVAADTVSVTPQISGNIIDWNISEGDTVTKGQILGHQDLFTMSTSSAVNTQLLTSSGSILAQKAVITAPISGRVIKSNVIVGQMAAQGQVLAIIADTKNLYISANIKETEVSKLKIGQTVDVKIDAKPGKTYKGRVEEIGQATASTFSILPQSNTGGNYIKVIQVIPVKIKLINIDADAEGLKIGMNAYVRIHIK